MGSPSESDIAADRAMRRLYRSLLGVDTAPGIPHHFGELIAIEDFTFHNRLRAHLVLEQQGRVGQRGNRLAHGVVVIGPHEHGGSPEAARPVPW